MRNTLSMFHLEKDKFTSEVLYRQVMIHAAWYMTASNHMFLIQWAGPVSNFTIMAVALNAMTGIRVLLSCLPPVTIIMLLLELEHQYSAFSWSRHNHNHTPILAEIVVF